MKNPNKAFQKINELAQKIANLSHEATLRSSEKEKDRLMNKIIDLAEAMEEVYSSPWH